MNHEAMSRALERRNYRVLDAWGCRDLEPPEDRPSLSSWAAAQTIDAVLRPVDEPDTLPHGTMPMSGFADDMGRLEELARLTRFNPTAAHVQGLVAEVQKLIDWMRLVGAEALDEQGYEPPAEQEDR